MKQLWTLLTLALLTAVIPSVCIAQNGADDSRPRGSIVVLPASALRSAPQNSPVVTAALEKVLGRQGYRVISGERVNRAIHELELDQPRIHPLQKIQDLRKTLDVDYVLYPRILTVGQGLEPDESQINILVNVAGRAKLDYLHTRQVGQVFKPAVLTPNPVVDAENAEKAAIKLLEGLDAKTGK